MYGGKDWPIQGSNLRIAEQSLRNFRENYSTMHTNTEITISQIRSWN